jgi:putative transposase
MFRLQPYSTAARRYHSRGAGSLTWSRSTRRWLLFIKLFGVFLSCYLAYPLRVAAISTVKPRVLDSSMERYRLIKPYLEGLRTLASVAAEANIPFRTAQRCVERYRKDGLASLARKERVDHGSRRVISDRMLETIEGLALEKPRVPIAAIYRELKEFAATTGEYLPSYPAIYRTVRAIPAGLLTLAHQGTRAYSETFDLVHRREASRSNAIWQADHAQLRIRLIREDGSTARPWLTIVIDDYSRAIAGYYLGFEAPSVLRTSLALRQGIWRKSDPRWQVCGIPDVLYTDNGSDFTSRHMEQVAIDLKIRLVFSTPGHPRGRGRIERFFRTVNDMFLCTLDGYLGKVRRKPSLTLEQLDTRFRSFLLDEYHCRLKSEDGPAPTRRWEDGGFLPRMPESLEKLDLLLVHEIRERKVRPDGIHFHCLRYLSPTLAAYVGESITVRYDPRDMAEIRVFYRDRFLCRAISADLAGEAVSLREIVDARNKRRHELRAIIMNRQKAVDTLLSLKRGRTLEEAHASSHVSEKSPASKLKRYRNE